MLPLAAGREASTDVRAARFARHRPDRSLLYQLFEEYYPALKADLAVQGAVLPEHVQREFADTSGAAAWNTASCGYVVTTAMPTLSPQPATFPPSGTANPCHGRSMA